MPLLDAYTASGMGIHISSNLLNFSEGSVGPEKSAAGSPAPTDAWKRLNEALATWRREPSQLEDDGTRPPSAKVIDRAIEFAAGLQGNGWPPFDRVVTTGDGGIALQADSGRESLCFEIDADGTIEFFQFLDFKLTARRPVALPFGRNADGGGGGR